MNWLEIAARAVSAIPRLVRIADQIKGAGRGQEKFQVVVDSLPEEIGVAETIAGKDVFEDAHVIALRDAAINAEAAAKKAIDAYHAGLLAKAPLV